MTLSVPVMEILHAGPLFSLFSPIFTGPILVAFLSFHPSFPAPLLYKFKNDWK